MSALASYPTTISQGPSLSPRQMRTAGDAICQEQIDALKRRFPHLDAVVSLLDKLKIFKSHLPAIATARNWPEADLVVYDQRIERLIREMRLLRNGLLDLAADAELPDDHPGFDRLGHDLAGSQACPETDVDASQIPDRDYWE